MDYNRYIRVRSSRSGRLRRARLNPKLATGESRYQSPGEAPRDRRSNIGPAKPDPRAPRWSVHHVKTLGEVMEEIRAENRYFGRT